MLVGAFNKEKVLVVGAFSVIVKTSRRFVESTSCSLFLSSWSPARRCDAARAGCGPATARYEVLGIKIFAAICSSRVPSLALCNRETYYEFSLVIMLAMIGGL